MFFKSLKGFEVLWTNLFLLQVRQAAFQLGVASQTAAEDKEFISVGLDLEEEGSSSSWDDNVLQTGCTHLGCCIRMTAQQAGRLTRSVKLPGHRALLQECAQCRQPACTACVCGPGSMVLARGGHGRGPPLRTDMSVLCKRYTKLLYSAVPLFKSYFYR